MRVAFEKPMLPRFTPSPFFKKKWREESLGVRICCQKGGPYLDLRSMYDVCVHGCVRQISSYPVAFIFKAWINQSLCIEKR